MTGIDLLRTAEIKKIPLFQGFNDTDYSQIADVADVVLFEQKKLNKHVKFICFKTVQRNLTL